MIIPKEQGRKRLPSLICTVNYRIEVSEVYLSRSAEHKENHWILTKVFPSVEEVAIVFARVYTILEIISCRMPSVKTKFGLADSGSGTSGAVAIVKMGAWWEKKYFGRNRGYQKTGNISIRCLV